MNPRFSLLLLMSCIVLFTANCKKNDTSTVASTTNGRPFDDLKTTPQNFKVTAGADQAITGAAGTVIRFYPNSFKDASGKIITSGTISIQLIEMYTPGKMLANGAPTVLPNGQPLISGGQVYIKALAETGQEVFANIYGLAFKQQAASSQPMILYYGNKSNADSAVSWSVSSRIGDTTSGTDTGYRRESVSGGGTAGPRYNFPGIYYIFDSCTNFNWVNCDHPFSSDCKDVTITFNFSEKLSGAVSYLSTRYYMILPSSNTAVDLAGLKKLSQEQVVTYAYAPLGAAYKLIVVHCDVNTGLLYYGETSGTISENFTVSMVLAQETIFNIKSRIGAL